MKKNISINISGIIFHIEEDGYDDLKRYLDSIHRYFSSFDDSSEILADIESRIAEIFLSKLSEEKQVITREDVQALMATMGSVSDFRAEETRDEGDNQHQEAGDAAEPESFAPPKRLWRDERRKILGGVCAGLGNYFEIDPLWFRLIFAALLPAGGFIILVYIVLWIAVPGSFELEDPVKGKKMFRDPQTRVIGGVSGGVAAYLGLDIIIVRVLFIGLAFAGGFGLLLYILLWVILPEAVTLTDRMRMQGEPVTLSNIESTIKRKLNIREGDSESTLSTVILFPFRVLGTLLAALGRVIEPFGEFVRVLAGIALVVIGFIMVLSVLITAGLSLGLIVGGFPGWIPSLADAGLPWQTFSGAVPGWLVLAAVVAALIPTLFVLLVGASVLARKWVLRGAVGWSMLAIFIASLGALAFGIPAVVYSFHEQGEHRVENVYPVNGKTIVLRVQGDNSNYEAVNLYLRGHDLPDLKLVQRYQAQGSSTTEAEKNARMVSYEVDFADSVLTFGRSLEFRDGAIFRGQQLYMTLFIPFDHPFVMEEDVSRLISQYVDRRYLDGYTWKMTTEGLECIDCQPEGEGLSLQSLRDFDAIKLTGRFDVRIQQGSQYNVEWRDRPAKGAYSIEKDGNTLVVDYKKESRLDHQDWESITENWQLAIDEVALVITVPDLRKLEATGMGRIRLEDLSAPLLAIDVRGPVHIRGQIRGETLDLNLAGRSDVSISGEVNELNARVAFASRLRGTNLIARNAFVKTSAGSSANVHVTGTLEIEEGIASRVNYHGNPENVTVY